MISETPTSVQVGVHSHLKSKQLSWAGSRQTTDMPVCQTRIRVARPKHHRFRQACRRRRESHMVRKEREDVLGEFRIITDG